MLGQGREILKKKIIYLDYIENEIKKNKKYLIFYNKIFIL